MTIDLVRSVRVELKRCIFFVLFLLASGLAFSYPTAQARLLEENSSSFALEYKELRILLQKVVNEQTAVTYKYAIKQQIDRPKTESSRW